MIIYGFLLGLWRHPLKQAREGLRITPDELNDDDNQDILDGNLAPQVLKIYAQTIDMMR